MANWLDRKLHLPNCQHMGPHFSRVAQCASRTLRGPQNARECAERHVRGTRAECVGRGSIARAALSARTVIARSGEWAALSAHFPRTCHAMPTQCNRGSTRVGRAEPQSPGTLRVKNNIKKKVKTFSRLWTHKRQPNSSLLQVNYGMSFLSFWRKDSCH